MTRRRVLFVDDEISVLEGLQNILRKQRGVWDMAFALGGKAALVELAKAPFDVIISDMKMPGMDGPTLLQTVQERYPNVARIVLSGQADRAAVLRSVPVTHQFLSKPCDATVLRGVIERTCRLQSLLSDDAACRVAGKFTGLPSVARAYAALGTALNRPDVALAELATIVEQDPAMSAKVLQLVNSAYFGLPQRVTSIPQAVMLLGADLLRDLFAQAGAFSMPDGAGPIGFSLEDLQTRSLRTARAARTLAGDSPLAEEAFAAAILRDIGQLVLSIGLPDEFRDCLAQSARDGAPLEDTERQILGVSHAEVGAYLLGVWGLPASLVETVAYHHRPSQPPSTDLPVLAILQAADRQQPRAIGSGPGAEIQ
jgi:HD-like signal output (HDOD) protein